MSKIVIVVTVDVETDLASDFLDVSFEFLSISGRIHLILAQEGIRGRTEYTIDLILVEREFLAYISINNTQDVQLLLVFHMIMMEEIGKPD